MSGNGEAQPLYTCAYDSSHTFRTLDAKFAHEPSCPANPSRVPESDNPER